MNKELLTRMLSDRGTAFERAVWLRDEYLPHLIQRFNVSNVRKRLGLYQGEKIPDNERNLTDVRNRVSLIIEYELARLSNDILKDHGVEELFWSYVVANRFPDLEVRRDNGERCLRVEVKCLQSIAEEKSANFDTLIKDIHPGTDFVVVFLWEWVYEDGIWDRAPKILRAYVFHAFSLASLRDTYWLNKPPLDLGDGYQGFDLRYGVNCSNGIYAVEEGNYGKLLRIWQDNFPYRPAETDELLDTEKEYLFFKSDVVLEGFKSLCKYHLPRMSSDTVEDIIENGDYKGSKSGLYGFILKSQISGSKELKEIMVRNGLNHLVTMTDKYISTGYVLREGRVVQKFKDKKPKVLSTALFNQDES
jgi:hypothetical protein